MLPGAALPLNNNPRFADVQHIVKIEGLHDFNQLANMHRNIYAIVIGGLFMRLTVRSINVAEIVSSPHEGKVQYTYLFEKSADLCAGTRLRKIFLGWRQKQNHWQSIVKRPLILLGSQILLEKKDTVPHRHVTRYSENFLFWKIEAIAEILSLVAKTERFRPLRSRERLEMVSYLE